MNFEKVTTADTVGMANAMDGRFDSTQPYLFHFHVIGKAVSYDTIRQYVMQMKHTYLCTTRSTIHYHINYWQRWRVFNIYLRTLLITCKGTYATYILATKQTELPKNQTFVHTITL